MSTSYSNTRTGRSQYLECQLRCRRVITLTLHGSSARWKPSISIYVAVRGSAPARFLRRVTISSARSPNARRDRHTRRPGQCSRLPNVCRHRGYNCSASRPKASSRAAFNASITRGLTNSTALLASAPHMEKVQGFCEADYALNAIATAVLGRAHFSSAFPRVPIPFDQHLAGLDRKFAPWRMRNSRWWNDGFITSRQTGNSSSRIILSACTAPSCIRCYKANRIT